MHGRMRGAAAVAVILVLIIIDLIIVGVVLSGSRGHDLTSRRVETVQAYYAAEAGMFMAMREVLVNTDEDGDCTIGSISHDGDSGNDPSFGPASFLAAASTTGTETTITSYGRAGSAQRHMTAVVNVPSAGSGTVTLEETVTASQGSGSPLVTPAIGAGTDQTYVLFIATRSNDDVTSVSGGGLTWAESIEQCAGRDQQGIRLWTAQGSPGSSFTVTINWTDTSSNPIVAILSRYSGVASFEGITGENTNGVLGGCSGGTDNDPTQITVTSTVDGSVHAIGVNSRNDPITSYTAGYTEIVTDQAGSSGDLTILTSYEKGFDPAGSEQFQGTTGDTNDWCTVGIVLNP